MGRQSRNRALNRVNRDKGLLPVAKQALDSKRELVVETYLSALSWNGYLKHGKGFIFCVNKEFYYIPKSEFIATTGIDTVRFEYITMIFDEYEPNTEFVLYPNRTKKDMFNEDVVFNRITPQIAPPEAYRLKGGF